MKIINFKYKQTEQRDKMDNKPQTSHRLKNFKKRLKQFISKNKKKWSNFTDKLTKLTVRVIAIILNIDVTPLFIFVSSYIITFDFPIVWRAMISIAIHQLYKMLVKDIISIARGRMK